MYISHHLSFCSYFPYQDIEVVEISESTFKSEKQLIRVFFKNKLGPSNTEAGQRQRHPVAGGGVIISSLFRITVDRTPIVVFDSPSRRCATFMAITGFPAVGGVSMASAKARLANGGADAPGEGAAIAASMARTVKRLTARHFLTSQHRALNKKI